MPESAPVRVRFAPSPTGYLHIGGARTALFNWLFARHHGGTFVLRMEDTDKRRNTPEARRTIFEGLRWLGLQPDEGPEEGGPHGPYSQSERTEIYAETIAELKRREGLYACFCSRERLAELRAEQEREKRDLRYDGRCRDLDPEEVRRRIEAGEEHTFRLRVPEGETVLEDLVRGPITVRHEDVEDIILVRADGTPVYNLAVVIDDHAMAISHVLRGEDHLTNTFKQIIVFKALGWEPPRYGHLPLILGPTGEGKLSKRKHPEAALEHYIRRGYHPEAMVNWLALIGWSYDDHTEIMSREELIERFSLDRVHAGGARLPLDKLDAMSGHYIRAMSIEGIAEKVAEELTAAGFISAGGYTLPWDKVVHLARILRDRLRCFGEIPEQVSWLFQPVVEFETKAEKNLLKSEETPILLRAYAATLEDPLPEPEDLEARARTFCEERGVGFKKLVHPVRSALTGRAGGPPLFDCLFLLGAEEARRRLEAAAAWAEARRPRK